jgi:hypothetical protein
MCVDCVLASPRIAQVYPDDEPLPEVFCHSWYQIKLKATHYALSLRIV